MPLKRVIHERGQLFDFLLQHAILRLKPHRFIIQRQRFAQLPVLLGGFGLLEQTVKLRVGLKRGRALFRRLHDLQPGGANRHLRVHVFCVSRGNVLPYADGGFELTAIK